MFRFIIPGVLVAIAVTAFFLFVQPLYGEIGTLRTEKASYDEALSNSKALENERDKLTQKYNSITAENLDRIKKLLPENVDNIRLILEIENVAVPYGMVLKDVKYNQTVKANANASAGEVTGGATDNSSREYGAWDLEFSTTGTYSNFTNFLKSLESNLRIVDISSIDFSSTDTPLPGSAEPAYQYRFKIKTYWLKN